MPLKDPVIDDRKYADILAEIRTRIPRYTPEWKPQWNDLNDSDPGMILAQTFAWLSEMLLFRMQRVPDLHYVKFLQLIGIELLPALPARAESPLPSPTHRPHRRRSSFRRGPRSARPATTAPRSSSRPSDR